MSDLHLKVEPLQGNELTIREGSALPLSHPKPLVVLGRITNASEYFQHRKSVIDALNSHVEVDFRKFGITICHNDTSNTSENKIIGKLEVNPDLVKFCINEEKEYTDSQLIKLLRLSRRFFKEASVHEAIYNGLVNFTAKILKDINHKNDFRGNTLNSLLTSVSGHAVPESFTLKMPIFEGFEPVEFQVKILLQDNNGLKFWLESVELAEMLVTQSEQIINSEIAKFSNELPIFYI